MVARARRAEREWVSLCRDKDGGGGMEDLMKGMGGDAKDDDGGDDDEDDDDLPDLEESS